MAALCAGVAPPAGAMSSSVEAVVMGDATVRTRGSTGPRRMQLRVTRCTDRLRSEWRSSDGRLLASDDVLISGSGFTRYTLARENLGQRITVTRSGSELEFRSGDGAPSQSVSVEPGIPVLAGPMLVTYVGERLAQLRAGRSLLVGYVIAERGMVLRLRIGAHAHGADGGLEVHADAASPLLRPFVPTTSMSFDAAQALVSMSGRILPQDAGALQPVPLDARVMLRPGAGEVPSACHNGSVA